MAKQTSLFNWVYITTSGIMVIVFCAAVFGMLEHVKKATENDFRHSLFQKQAIIKFNRYDKEIQHLKDLQHNDVINYTHLKINQEHIIKEVNKINTTLSAFIKIKTAGIITSKEDA